MNKVYLIGNLTRDPESSQTSQTVSYCRFSIAVNRTYVNAEGNRETDFFNIIAWRNLADTCSKFLKKGSKVAVVGSLQNRSYEDKDGVKRNVTDIVATEVEFLSSGNRADDNQEEKSFKPEKGGLEEVSDENVLPF